MTQDEEVLARLTRIESKLDKVSTQGRRDVVFGVGIAAIIGSLAALPFSPWGAAVLFVLGFLIMMFSPFLSHRR